MFFSEWPTHSLLCVSLCFHLRNAHTTHSKLKRDARPRDVATIDRIMNDAAHMRALI